MSALALAACDRPEKQERREEATARQMRHEAIAKRGPHYELTKQVGDGEEISVLLLPHPEFEFQDQRCLVYKNAKLNAVAVNCPQEFDPPEYERDEAPEDPCQGGRAC